MPMCVDSRKWLFVTLLVAAMALVCGEGSFGFEFLEKRDCTLTFKARPPLHTTCVIQGGIQGGSLDVSIRTPVGWSNRRRGARTNFCFRNARSGRSAIALQSTI